MNTAPLARTILIRIVTASAVAITPRITSENSALLPTAAVNGSSSRNASGTRYRLALSRLAAEVEIKGCAAQLPNTEVCSKAI